MKTKKTIGVALAMALAVSFAYWLGYQHGNSSSQVQIIAPGKLTQVGLKFRDGRNDVSRFNATGAVMPPLPK